MRMLWGNGILNRITYSIINHGKPIPEERIYHIVQIMDFHSQDHGFLPPAIYDASLRAKGVKRKATLRDMVKYDIDEGIAHGLLMRDDKGNIVPLKR